MEARLISSSLRHWNHKYSCRHTYHRPLKGKSKAVDCTQLQGPVARPWQHGNEHTSFLNAGNVLNTCVMVSPPASLIFKRLYVMVSNAMHKHVRAQM